MRRALTVAVVLAAVAALWMPTRNLLERLPLRDFASYWAAALLVNHNPYDIAAVHLLERSVGIAGDAALIMRNPPWALLLVAPLRWMSLEDARTLWFFLSVAAIAFASVEMWRQTNRARPFATAWLVATFVPILILLLLGQITWLMLLGLALFLRYLSAGRLLPAGAALSLLTIKPHLVLPLFVVLVVWSVRQREWRLLGGLAVAVASACTLLLIFTPQVFAQYAAYLRFDDFSSGSVQTLGGELMRRTGKTWFRWAPSLVAATWAIWYWYTRREQWDWRVRYPALLVAGIVAAPYGFTFDQVLLLGALIPALTRAPLGTFAAGAALINLAYLAPLFNGSVPDPHSSSTTAAAWAVVYALSAFLHWPRDPARHRLTAPGSVVSQLPAAAAHTTER